MEAGLDSLAGIELRNITQTRFDIELPATIIFDHPTLQSLAGYIKEHRGPTSAHQNDATASKRGSTNVSLYRFCCSIMYVDGL